MCRRLALLLTLLALPVGAQAATYYVDPATGSDVNAGTSTGAAWETPPGTRVTDNSAFLNSAWGSITTTNKIACGDTILLKGGSTHSTATVTNGGAWRIDPSYYTSNCTAASPITVQIASNAQWTGSTGHFTLDGTGITNTSTLYGASGACSDGGRCALVDIENVSGIIVTGLSDTQRIVLTDVDTSGTATSGLLLKGPDGAFSQQHIQLGWMEISGNSGLETGSAMDVGDLKYSWIHDVKIHDWLGPGINTGMFTGAHRVHSLVIENADIGPNVGNNLTDSCLPTAAPGLYLPGAEYHDATAGGGVWCLNCNIHDNYADGYNAFGCNSGGEDGIAKLRDVTFVGNGTNNTVCGYGMESAGDPANCYLGSENALPEQTTVTIRGRWYNNRRAGIDTPHGGGSQWHWHPTFFRPGDEDAGIAIRLDSAVMLFANGIFDSSSSGLPVAFGYAGGSGHDNDGNRVAPNVFNMLVRGATSSGTVGTVDTQCTTDNGTTWTGTKCQSGSCASGQTCRQRSASSTYASPAGFLVGNGNVVGTSDPQFASIAGDCDTAFVSGTGAPGYGDCDLRLLATSPAIDPATPVYVLLANGAGVDASTITVKAGTVEPEQVWNGPTPAPTAIPGSNYPTVAAGLSWGARPHAADPRTYFISPENHPWATGDVLQIVGTCTDGVATHGAAGRARIVSMTSTTITVDDTCTWADGAGVHWPFSGTAPDMGAYEYDASQRPVLRSVTSVP